MDVILHIRSYKLLGFNYCSQRCHRLLSFIIVWRYKRRNQFLWKCWICNTGSNYTFSFLFLPIIKVYLGLFSAKIKILMLGADVLFFIDIHTFLWSFICCREESFQNNLSHRFHEISKNCKTIIVYLCRKIQSIQGMLT